ncbi:MAG: PaaI family thioesterase [Phycisphaerales bacterium]|nr:PaaI family thioesterase [Phycisphaerales bacterium]
MIPPQRIAAIIAKAQTAPCIDAVGIDLLEFDEGFIKLTARHDPRFNGVLPGFHGGMLAMVADCVAWFAIVTQTGPDEPLVTTDLDVRYLNPCMGDVTAEGRVIKLGKTLCPVEVRMSDAADKLVAIATVTYIRVGNLGS